MSIRKHIDLIESELGHEDTLSFDIPLFIRILEFSRETLKSDEQLHKFVERLLSMKGRVLTMDDYDDIMRGLHDTGSQEDAPHGEQPTGPVEEDGPPQGPEHLISLLGQHAQEKGEATCKLVDDQEPVAQVVAKNKMGAVRFYFKSLDRGRIKTKHFALNPTMSMDAKRATATLEMISTKAVGRLRSEEDRPLDEKSPPGWSGSVKAMKKHHNIKNPWALAWWMKGRGAHPHHKPEKK